MSATYRVAVRALCDFTAREGDLDHRFTPAPSAQEGIQGHTLVASRRGADYIAELPLSGTFEGLTVTGRADGFDPTANRLEEVKTHRGSLERMAENQRALHWAQVKVYGALLCAERGLQHITLTLVYLEIASGKETLLSQEASATELQAFFIDQCQRFLAWAEQESDHRQRRDSRLQTLRFPYSTFRPGQRELAEDVYKATSTGRCLLAQAPTGIGKTVATLFPMLSAMPRQQLDRIAFLTMKTPGRRLALDALATLRASPGEEAQPLRVLELVARDKACEYPDRACHGESCPLAAGFYDRLPAARQAAVEQAWLDREALREVALAHDVCPYYLGQELARWTDVVVGDVNHWFDSHALLHGLAQANDWRTGVLVDEAHNLVERARGMYSAELDQQRLNRVRRGAPPALSRPLNRLARQWQALFKETFFNDTSLKDAGLDEAGEPGKPGYRLLTTLPDKLVSAAQQVGASVTDHLGEHPEDASLELQELLFEALAFCRLAERFGEHSLCDLTRYGRGRAVLGLRNLIPADFLAPRFNAAHSVVLFSATLTPAHYYRDLLGLPEKTVWREVASPFAARQLEVRIRCDISTRFRDRDASIEPIVATMAQQYQRRPGHYLAFFSSFAYLAAALARFREAHPEVPVFSQTRGMPEAEREAFLARFTPGGKSIGFAVLGGAFAEGIDLPGDRLIGAFIATLGLPPFNDFNEALKARLSARFGQGDDYTYRIPGMIKVVQAAGRVIRSPEDEGVVVLMDDRFAQANVCALLPSWWAVETMTH
ncbi:MULTISPECIES: ATP-dependent DNA helicase [unclassified Halomonas]|uniref:ATP-dependent DNA helicase n=1 Tax=unclassified Halomonas TaxID=2609666 RepID=UPI0007D94D37|nr:MULTISPECIES: ATP-dependent DNA helicase [unclassified Halomonas]MBT2785739.1 ATP-dependent DNA helicase [Halomonas sp. ISL-106]MBT2798793.1 ATP-dependent DNA helicase [Halomonas sp. ISL-104]OAL59158.1 ATP-dependent DNA helicase [Halomonas sp. ALS9]